MKPDGQREVDYTDGNCNIDVDYGAVFTHHTNGTVFVHTVAGAQIHFEAVKDVDSITEFAQLATDASTHNFNDWPHRRPFDENLEHKGDLFYLAAALAGEAGETLNIVKKFYRDDKLMLQDLADELGDVAWYWVQLCKMAGLKPEAILAGNIKKLRNRKREKEQ